ncbi:MAG: hypothetical protein WED00_05710 [Aquisalimonadaceae bacterium]
MPLNKDRNTPMQDGELVAVPVAAGVEIFAGSLVVADATGYAAPGSEADDVTYLGRAEEHVDNADGDDGDVSVRVRRGKAFKWANSGTDPIDQAGLGQTCFIEDDETVSATDNTGARSAAGTVIQIDDDGVWVQ